MVLTQAELPTKLDMSGVKSETDWNNPRSEMKETLQTSFVRSSVSLNCKTITIPVSWSYSLLRDAQTTLCERVKEFLIFSWIWDGLWWFSSLHWVTAALRIGPSSRNDSLQAPDTLPWANWNSWMRPSLPKECRIQHMVITFCSISLSGYRQLLQRFNLVHWSENTLGERTL